MIDEFRHAPAEAAVKFAQKCFLFPVFIIILMRRKKMKFRRIFEWQFVLQHDLIHRINFDQFMHHLLDHDLLFQRRVELIGQSVITQQCDAADRMIHIRESRDGNDVPRDLLAFFLYFVIVFFFHLEARRKTFEIGCLRYRAEYIVHFTIGRHLIIDRLSVNRKRFTFERRDQEITFFDLDIPLAHLFGIIIRMAVEETPDELSRDIGQLELEIRMRKDRMMPGLVHALRERKMFIGDLIVPHNAFGGITSPRGRDRILKRRREGFRQYYVRFGGEEVVQDVFESLFVFIESIIH